MDDSSIRKPSASSIVLKMGLLLGALEITNTFLGYYSGQMEQGKNWLGWIFFAIEAVIAVLWIKKFRDDQLGGYVTFGTAFGITLRSALVSGLIAIPCQFIFMHILHPGVMEHILQVTEAKLVANGTPDDQIEMAMKIPRYMFSHPAVTIAFQSIIFIFTGVILGIVVAAICKKERREFAAV